MGLSEIVRITIVSALATAAAACTVQTASGGEGVVGGTSGGSGAPPTPPCLGCTNNGGAEARVPAGSKDPSAFEMLGRVAPGYTMNASPGEGVGVFTEYDTGGHWRVFWTCDTNITGESCPFDVKVSVAAGVIANTTSNGFTSRDTLITPSTPASGEAGGIEARTLTTTGTAGLAFDTDPGATITLSATVSDLYNGRFLFWVQGGKVDDGYHGTITDPLMLVGQTP